MRMSRLYAPTLRAAPAEAEVPSHQLMLRAGLIRRAAAGVYTWLPLGLRVLHKVAAVVREEMDRAGLQEVLLPILQPAELWHRSGRWADYGPELFRLADRQGRGFALGPTHEEIITDLLQGEVRSYRQLPLCLYQIQLKYRDEIRPRFGVMRSREFLMKDAYSFDRDEAGLDESYRRLHGAYERVFRRLGVAALAVQADPGAIGGSGSEEFVIPSEWGEAHLVSCPSCAYLANVEQAVAVTANAAALDANAGGDGGEADSGGGGPAAGTTASPELTKVHTPGMVTVEAVSAFLGVRPGQLVKTLIVVTPSGEAVAALVRGDHELSLAKLARALGVATVTMAGPEEVERATGAAVGFAGPVGLAGVRIIADEAVRCVSDGVTGANEADYHWRGVRAERDFGWDLAADIREVEAGDPCPECGQALAAWRGMELGHVFKLGTKYSEAFGATFAAEDGEVRPAVMGCYGIGISRTAAAIVEMHRDEDGIKWPWAAAPYHVLVMPVNDRDEAQAREAERIYAELLALGVETVLDDRPERAGVKFRDADLIGWPVRVTVGARALAEGYVEVRVRASGEDLRPAVASAAPDVAALVRAGLAEVGLR